MRCNECEFDLEDHWFDDRMVMICPKPIEDFIVTDPPEVEWDWTGEDEMLFNTYSEYMEDYSKGEYVHYMVWEHWDTD